jgi:hypothetical protein
MKPVLFSLAEFVMAGLRPRTPLAKAVVLALAIKLVVIVTMKVFLFSGEARPVVDDAVMNRVLGPSGSTFQLAPTSASARTATNPQALEFVRGSGG